MSAEATEPKMSGPDIGLRFPKEKSVVYCIGSQKAGTTWLADYVAGHSECFIPPMKECHFFDVRYGFDLQARKVSTRRMEAMLAEMHDVEAAPYGAALSRLRSAAERAEMFAPGDRGLKAYLKVMLRGPEHQNILCDFTPSYATCDRVVFRYMSEMANDARFIFIMRDPVDRLWSQARMASKNITKRNQDADFEKLARMSLQYYLGNYSIEDFPRSNYARTITELESVIPQDQILYLFYETLFTEESIRRVCDFMGMAYEPAEFDAQSNVGRDMDLPASVEQQLREGLAGQYAFIREKFGDAVPEDWLQVEQSQEALASLQQP